MSRAQTLAFCARWSFPRVSGDEPNEEVEALGYAEFSPRERG